MDQIVLEGRNFSTPTYTSSSWTYNTVLDNLSNLTIFVSYTLPAIFIRVSFDHYHITYYTDPTSVIFANQTIALSGDTLKMNIKIGNWPFKSIQNSLVFVLDTRTNTQTQSCINTGENTDGSLQWVLVSIGGVQMYQTKLGPPPPPPFSSACGCL